MKKKVVTIVGARPQFIKAATISRVLKNSTTINEIIVHTGQHHDPIMSDIFFEELQIPKPAHFLNIQGGNHGQMTGRMMEAIEGTLLYEQPDAVLVYGDTNSTLAGALTAAKLHIPVIHVEAGLRSFNRTMPEEINRVLTDHVSNLLLCPTYAAVNNLANEGITKGVHYTGDVMYDATVYAIEIVKNIDSFAKFDNISGDYALLTVHRAESTDSKDNFQKIIDYVHDFSVENNMQILFPVHPRTRKLMDDISANCYKNIKLLEPLSYFEIQALLSKASCVLTDSGGLQKEAYFHRVPCITLRTETEWVETVDNGWNKLWTQANYKERKPVTDYGVGKAAEMIADLIQQNIYS